MAELNVCESYITVPQFCEILQLSHSTAYRMIKTGKVRAMKVGRRYKIPYSELKKISEGEER